MTDGTHEWRIMSLEKRMDQMESKIQTAMYALIGNLMGVIAILVKLFLIPAPK